MFPLFAASSVRVSEVSMRSTSAVLSEKSPPPPAVPTYAPATVDVRSTTLVVVLSAPPRSKSAAVTSREVIPKTVLWKSTVPPAARTVSACPPDTLLANVTSAPPVLICLAPPPSVTPALNCSSVLPPLLPMSAFRFTAFPRVTVPPPVNVSPLLIVSAASLYVPDLTLIVGLAVESARALAMSAELFSTFTVTPCPVSVPLGSSILACNVIIKSPFAPKSRNSSVPVAPAPVAWMSEASVIWSASNNTFPPPARVGSALLSVS